MIQQLLFVEVPASELTTENLSAEMVFSLLKSVQIAAAIPAVDPMVARCLSNLTSGGIDAIHAENLCSTSGSAVRNASEHQDPMLLGFGEFGESNK
mmetsp:Transcript_39882/g.83471  ORF Transcript_39882/g.83471 Transcript_39882/m.83471 type:complete len:96 (+) Transcript_39882:153-440(+)